MTEQVSSATGSETPTPLVKLPFLCRLGRHDWNIWCVNMAGHQSYRERRCLRCLDYGEGVFERQQLGYFGKPLGSWERRKR